MVLNVEVSPAHKREVAWGLRWTSQLNQLIVSACLISVNCCLPICLAFFGEQTRTTAKGPANDHELGRETSSTRMAQISDGRRSPKKPTIINVEKTYQASRLFWSWDATASCLASQSKTTSSANGIGGRKLDGCCSSQPLRMFQVFCNDFLKRGLDAWTYKTACFATRKAPFAGDLFNWLTNFSKMPSTCFDFPRAISSHVWPWSDRKVFSARAPSTSLPR